MTGKYDVIYLKIGSSVVAMYFIWEIIISHVSIAFVTRNASDPLRSVAFAMFSFLQLAIAFATFFVVIGEQFCFAEGEGAQCTKKISIGIRSALYFSILIITTVGWGDIVPHRNAWLAKALICLELIVALAFLASVLQIFVDWSNQHRTNNSG